MRTIRDNLLAVRENIAAACARAGRSEDDVLLVAVSKYVDIDRIAEALDAGVTDVGENHAQEVREKLTFFEQRACGVHFIGQLQSNKIKYVCGRVKLIHSVDRLSLAEQISQRAARMDFVQDILLQVNIGAEQQKGGAAREDMLMLIDAIRKLPAVRLCGLMCVPPAVEQDGVRPYFAQLRELLDTACAAYPELPLTHLSMGMSHDYGVAIEEGATIVRVGSAIFGARNRM